MDKNPRGIKTLGQGGALTAQANNIHGHAYTFCIAQALVGRPHFILRPLCIQVQEKARPLLMPHTRVWSSGTWSSFFFFYNSIYLLRESLRLHLCVGPSVCTEVRRQLVVALFSPSTV